MKPERTRKHAVTDKQQASEQNRDDLRDLHDLRSIRNGRSSNIVSVVTPPDASTLYAIRY